MKSIGKFKVTQHKPKANISYPMVRLPQSYSEIIGETAYVYEIDSSGKPVFVISFDEDVDENSVAQHFVQSNLETRLGSIEKKLSALIELQNR
ncbi:hypothetical protein [Methanolobus sp. ZRKC5]|uniref:hypothetical protein n=1 Tax=unclassified Methanolobus TaxID=2629569 RepID=UPI00313F3B8D